MGLSFSSICTPSFFALFLEIRSCPHPVAIMIVVFERDLQAGAESVCAFPLIPCLPQTCGINGWLGASSSSKRMVMEIKGNVNFPGVRILESLRWLMPQQPQRQTYSVPGLPSRWALECHIYVLLSGLKCFLITCIHVFLSEHAASMCMISPKPSSIMLDPD